eukprot:NODE_10509_length_304_cov_175.963855.p2 GENE.NODE_10509_length_304_cov_175.963855~~NODE_10509_length_304_cov_175.963855.p2  ORF type:complete len:72 (-),score=12.12 NODE_10509_length_304_cov_175.963855:72-257(-)
MRALAWHVLDLQGDFNQLESLGNTAIMELRIREPDHWYLARYNDTEHLWRPELCSGRRPAL